MVCSMAKLGGKHIVGEFVLDMDLETLKFQGRIKRMKKMAKLIDVLKAKTEMLEYLTSENCTIDPELMSAQGFVLGQQVRIWPKNASDKYGLVTLHSEYQDGTDNNDIRMRLSGRQRFDESDSFDAYMDAPNIKTDYTKSQLESYNEYGEILTETNTTHTDVVVCAPHGGVIENYTDEEADLFSARLALHHSKNCSCWVACGWQDAIGAFDAWHITSTDISRASFELLDQIGDRGFCYAVSFHGFSEDSIMVGGGASSTLKNEVKTAIENAVNGAYDVEVVSSGPYGGVDPDNFVNWLTRGGSGGVQIEQPYGARQNYGQAIAEAVADVFASRI